jgi:deazaflavin-dependent oxidoreductase (nitroreductase family)
VSVQLATHAVAHCARTASMAPASVLVRSTVPAEVRQTDLEAMRYARANIVQRALRRLAASGPGSWLFARVLHRIDRPVHRLTRGRHTLASLVAGIPVVMLTTTGARTGKRRTVPVLGLPTADGLAVIASNYGQARHPAWYHNLRANPEAEVAVDGQRRRVRAVEVEGERRARIWQQGLKVYPGWAQYERRAAHRRITVFVLEAV